MKGAYLHAQLRSPWTWIPAIFLFFLMAPSARAGSEAVPWTLERNPAGAVVRMTCTDPPTETRTEHEIAVDIASPGVATGGTVTETDGAVRTMSPKEAAVYWADLGGPAALWDDLAERGQLADVTTTGTIPESWYDREARVITTDGVDLVGRILPPTQYGLYALQEDGAQSPILFTMAGVREIQEPGPNCMM